MIFSKHRRVEAKRRFGSRDFRSKVRQNQSYKRPYNPINLNRSSRWLVIFGLRSKFYRVVWIGLIFAFVYLFMFSKYLVVAEVEVSGNSKLSSDQIKEVVLNLQGQRTFFVPQSNFFLLTKSRLKKNLAQAQPLVKDIVNYKRSWPNKVKLEIVERDPGFVILANEKRYLVDDEGFVVNDNPVDLNLPLVVDQVQENFDIGEPLPNTKMVAFILSIHKQWSTKINSTITETKIPGKASNEAQFVSSEGWTVFFDTNRAVSAQLDNLSLVLTKQIPARERVNLAYIDLRLSKWAYYCFKNTPCVAGAQSPEEGVELEEGGEATVLPKTNQETVKP